MNHEATLSCEQRVASKRPWGLVPLRSRSAAGGEARRRDLTPSVGADTNSASSLGERRLGSKPLRMLCRNRITESTPPWTAGVSTPTRTD
jgi:hypothetical protein